MSIKKNLFIEFITQSMKHDKLRNKSIIITVYLTDSQFVQNTIKLEDITIDQNSIYTEHDWFEFNYQFDKDTKFYVDVNEFDVPTIGAESSKNKNGFRLEAM